MSLTPSAAGDLWVSPDADGAAGFAVIAGEHEPPRDGTARRAALALGLVTIAVALVRCDVHDGAVDLPNATLALATSADVGNVLVPADVPLTAAVEHVYLVAPDDTPPPEHSGDAGYLVFHLDDESRPALRITADPNVVVHIPGDTLVGYHDIICRVYKHDGTATHTNAELTIAVKTTLTTPGSVHPTGGAGGYGGGSAGAGGQGGLGGVGGLAVAGAVGTPDVGGAQGGAGIPLDADAGAPPLP